jgi:lipoprotein NlpI
MAVAHRIERNQSSPMNRSRKQGPIASYRALFVLLGTIALGSPAASATGLDLAQAGLAAQQQGEWGKAIELYTQALAAGDLPAKTQARVLGLRANAYGAIALPDQALADFAAALAITPDDPAPYVGRGIVYRQMGDYDKAIADDDTAIAHSPGYALAFTNRGIANFYAGHFAAAAEDFAKSHADDPAEPDFVLWLHLAHARAGENDSEEFARNAGKIDRNQWAGAAVYFYLGQVKAGDLPAAAATGNSAFQRQQGCEASFYLGEGALLAGHKDEARRFFQSVLDACDLYKFSYSWFSQAYGAAKEELKRLDQ